MELESWDDKRIAVMSIALLRVVGTNWGHMSGWLLGGCLYLGNK